MQSVGENEIIQRFRAQVGACWTRDHLRIQSHEMVRKTMFDLSHGSWTYI